MSETEPLMVTYLHNKGVEKGLPVSGTFELTQRCNFNCEMCYVHDLKIKKDPLSAEDWINLGKQAKEMGTIFLLLTGGEPTLRDDFAQIYEALIKMGFMISINTNGSLVDKYLDLFKKYPPSRFNITLYGSDKESYKSLCKVNKFKKVTDNIRLLKENGFDVKINMVVTPTNAYCYKNIIDVARDIDVPVKPTAYAFPQIRLGEHNDDIRFTPEQAAQYTLDIDRYVRGEEAYNRKMSMFCELEEGPHSDKVRCRAGRASFWITADGIMRPCGMMKEPNAYPLRDGLQKAWKDTLLHTSKIRLPKECVDCKYSGICMVCAAMCQAETGSFNKKPEYICKMVKEFYNIAVRESEGKKDEDKKDND